MTESPQLLIIAGPNGAGKSTFSKDLSPANAFIFDPDKEKALIVSKFTGLPAESINFAFEQRFQDLIETAIKNRRDFVIETNFRDNNLWDIANRFKANGYAVNMIYFLLASIHESIDRVTSRINNGGHYVDEASIRYNYIEGLENLKYFADRFDKLEVVDASGSFLQLRSVLSIQQKQLIYISDDVPENTKQVITDIARRFNSRRSDENEDRDQGYGLTR